MNRLTLALGAIAIAAMCSTSALADTFSFTFTGFEYSGSGTFTTDAGVAGPFGSTQYDITSFTSGSVTPDFGPSSNITGISTFSGADNEVFDPGIFGIYQLDANGISFTLANGGEVNLAAGFFTYYADANVPFSTEAVTFTLTDDSTSPSPVPEPGSLALLGTGVLGLAGFVRRRLAA